MDPDSDTQTETQGDESDPLSRYISNVSDVLSPVWLRRIVQINNGFEWFVLGSRYNFLFNFRLLLVIVYLTYETFR